MLACLTSQQHVRVSQGRICSNNLRAASQRYKWQIKLFCLSQSQYTNTGPTSPSVETVIFFCIMQSFLFRNQSHLSDFRLYVLIKLQPSNYLFHIAHQSHQNHYYLSYLLTYAHHSQWSIGHQRPPAIALCSGLLLSFRTSWSPAVLALLQCLASNCCEAGLSSSSPAGSRSGLGM